MIMDKKEENLMMDECSFGIIGLKLQGADCIENKLHLSPTILTELCLTTLRWFKIQPGEVFSKNLVTLPVYLNSTRAELLFTVDLAAASGQNKHSFYERGVAVMCSTALS
ncbi:dynein heavy chain, cytoplasmic-like [Limulus polyphemus]|uniref:Dynein heavy chain, cytoplasmic-like n=1 Tax=Limulus polyphemus TaxID=6850 RepID=A0ABM1BZ78_LIMPO|nr:dynein heavy chain, cytoplasmic-like [Limulus polyphemus]